jgi:hypothetical protein
MSLVYTDKIKICGDSFEFTREEIECLHNFFLELEKLRQGGHGEISLTVDKSKINLGKLYKVFKNEKS